MDTKERIIDLLKRTNRKGIKSLIEYLLAEGFFESPASTRFRGCYAGGLAKHSLRVYELLDSYSYLNLNAANAPSQKTIEVHPVNIVIAALLHDVCKIGAFVRTKADDGWTSNRKKEKGHALLSIERIKKYIELTDIEEMMIKFHMGTYGTNEFESYCSEYPIRGDKSKSKEERYGKSLANAWYHNPIVKLMYFCDEIATLEAKASEDK